jgi:hypothetical protein
VIHSELSPEAFILPIPKDPRFAVLAIQTSLRFLEIWLAEWWNVKAIDESEGVDDLVDLVMQRCGLKLLEFIEAGKVIYILEREVEQPSGHFQLLQGKLAIFVPLNIIRNMRDFCGLKVAEGTWEVFILALRRAIWHFFRFFIYMVMITYVALVKEATIEALYNMIARDA